MNCLKLSTVAVVCCLLQLYPKPLFAQPALFLSGNNSYVGLEKNVLFNAGSRFTVTQTGTRQFGVAELFDGGFGPQYLTGFDGNIANAVVLEIAGLPQAHTQLGAFVGFTTRYYGAKRFKIEGFNIHDGSNVWIEIANETNNTQDTYTKQLPAGTYSKLKFTFYEAITPSGPTAGWIGIGELFFLHSEAARAYDGITVQYAANGSVGIGTETPNANYKLNVNGKIRSQEIKVENTSWPDYVFAKDYQLPALSETEKHIKEKGHLPGIPTAAEVKTNGIDLGEMNAKLLQKIEELTLHLIELKKENLRQQSEIDLLKVK